MIEVKAGIHCFEIHILPLETQKNNYPKAKFILNCGTPCRTSDWDVTYTSVKFFCPPEMLQFIILLIPPTIGYCSHLAVLSGREEMDLGVRLPLLAVVPGLLTLASPGHRGLGTVVGWCQAGVRGYALLGIPGVYLSAKQTYIS